MGVDRDPFTQAIGVAEHAVRGLAADPRKGSELRHRSGNLAVVIGNQRTRQADQAAGLVAEEPGGSNDLLDLRLLRLRERERIGPAPKELRGDHVDPHIGALG